MLIDSHCHLDRLDLTPYKGKLNTAIEAAISAGVERMLCISIDMNNVQTVINIAQQYQHVFTSVGVHPVDAKTVVNFDNLFQLTQKNKVVAIGETGLDYFHSQEYKKTQQESFVVHLQVSKKSKLPTVVHTRSAQKDTLALIKQYADQDTAGVLHCFTEDWSMAKAAIDMNFYISISGIVTFKNATNLQEVVKKLPLDRLLIETDSPYLAPVPYRGRPNEPKYLPEICQFIASLKNVSEQAIQEHTSNNFFNLFPKTY